MYVKQINCRNRAVTLNVAEKLAEILKSMPSNLRPKRHSSAVLCILHVFLQETHCPSLSTTPPWSLTRTPSCSSETATVYPTESTATRGSATHGHCWKPDCGSPWPIPSPSWWMRTYFPRVKCGGDIFFIGCSTTRVECRAVTRQP